MSKKKPQIAVKPLSYCGTHKAGVAIVRDGTGKDRVQPFKSVDPDFPPEEGTPVLHVAPGGPDESGWYKGNVTPSSGPPKVNSEAYRRGWARVFGKGDKGDGDGPVGEA
jgi:hypothetical protein